jgi:pimeloyl-ACP methyl ester carboxylesterase
MSPRAATADDETITFLEAGPETILAVLTAPGAEPLKVGVIFLPGGGAPLTTGRNRFAVRLSRDVAPLGFHAIRLDYHGAGESTGSIRHFRLDRPFIDDASAAMSILRLQGVEHFVLVGSCFGSRTALAVAAAFPEVIAVAMVSCPVRDFEMGQHTSVLAAERRSIWAYVAKGLHPRMLGRLTKRSWRATYRRHAMAKLRTMVPGKRSSERGTQGITGVSDRFLGDMRDLVERKVPMLLIYGDDEYLFDDFQRAHHGELGDLLASAGDRVTMRVLEGSVHGFTRVDVQDAVLSVIVEWLRRLEPLTEDEPEAPRTSDRAARAGTIR